MKFEIFNFKKVTSTNDKAIDLIKKKEKETGCVYAAIQTRGRGTHGKRWISNVRNLFISIFFPIKKNFPTFQEFTIISPIIVSEVINKYCNKNKITYKPPNDLLVDGKKICGILQDVITFNNKKFLIIGIGINVIKNPIIKNKYSATNIFSKTQKKPSLDELIKLIVKGYEDFFYNLRGYNFINFKNKANLMSGI